VGDVRLAVAETVMRRMLLDINPTLESYHSLCHNWGAETKVMQKTITIRISVRSSHRCASANPARGEARCKQLRNSMEPIKLTAGTLSQYRADCRADRYAELQQLRPGYGFELKHDRFMFGKTVAIPKSLIGYSFTKDELHALAF
jgi:hypothetical protein